MADLPFKPTCPRGGNFYACANGSQFVGCCAVYPCTGGCSDGNLRTASFDKSFYNDLKDQSCPDASWYTCANMETPFMGCCKRNPCLPGGCRQKDLSAGKISLDPQKAKVFLPQAATTSSSSTTTSSPSTSASSPAAASTAEHHPSIGLIVGVSVGGTIAVIAVVALFIIFFRRTKKARPQRGAPIDTNGTWKPKKEPSTVGEQVEYTPLPQPPPEYQPPEASWAKPELMDSPQRTHVSSMSELDGSPQMQRPVAISNEASTAQSTPQFLRQSPNLNQADAYWGR